MTCDGSAQELEGFIRDWHHDENSHARAREMGAFLLGALAHLRESGSSERTLRQHRSNLWLIGKFECDYADDGPFGPERFPDAPQWRSEFRRKVSGSEWAWRSYCSTWRLLERYSRKQTARAER
ncbi:hypothetical protein DYH09_05295 [bacterium CPR1]|nr:hypothetical protein [bacterium CPR1]